MKQQTLLLDTRPRHYYDEEHEREKAVGPRTDFEFDGFDEEEGGDSL